MSEAVSFVVYWEKTSDERGFVSYDNNSFDIERNGLVRKQYEPVAFHNATRYKTQKEAQKIADWYISRGGFGLFLVMKI